ncbi:MAG: hypothetical protein IJZ89_03510 [Clostridia bacterium]|nr:hypothetical protein [Clostridia bacterium]
MEQTRISIFSGNALKFIAAFAMVTDHVGMILFPDIRIFRIIGRIAFPIFAYMIAEGCRYTKDKLRYFLSVFLLGALCQSVYIIYENDMYMNVLITFSLSIMMIFALQNFKKALFGGSSAVKKLAAAVLFVFSMAAAFIINIFLEIDYGFTGSMIALLASLPSMPLNAPEYLKRFDRIPFKVLLMGIGLIPLGIIMGGSQLYAVLALPFLLLYNGKRGKFRTKYFFYIFYPLHLALIEGISHIL